MVESENEGIREQNHYGSGPFIGRDNYGQIRYETLDLKTKAVLAKLSKDAPDLAKLLKRALSDGIISPNAVAALESAVRNINEDVAASLMLAGRNINEDVAMSLMLAGQNINDDVAEKLLEAANSMREATSELNYSLPVNELYGGTDLGRLVGLAGTITNAAERIERGVAPPPPSGIHNWWATCKTFAWGVAAGFVVGATLIFYLMKR